MEQIQDYNVFLEQIQSPAFLVMDGIITVMNSKARQYTLEANTPVLSILTGGLEEYSQFQNGSIYVNLTICGVPHSCTVTQLQDRQLFTMDQNTSAAELQVLALAAQQLCMPISEISLMLERLTDLSDIQKAKIIQNLNRLQRMIGNMSDAGQFSTRAHEMVTHNLCAIFEETLEKSKELLLKSSLQLEYKLPANAVYGLADEHMLKRALYNMISNAAKFTPAGGKIYAEVKQSANRLYFSVTDGSKGKSASVNIFHRYTRQPGLEDHRFGLGLGMTFIHSAAVAHGGTVLAEQTDEQNLKITMTVAIKKSKSTDVRSPILIPDIYGGRDQALIELSDVLDYHLYIE